MPGPIGCPTNKPIVDRDTLSRQQSKSPGITCATLDHSTAIVQVANEAPPRSKWRVHFGFQAGKPVIYEYARDQHLCTAGELSFKTAKPRGWYEVGDLILCGEQDERWLQRMFKDLRDTDAEGHSGLFDLACTLLTLGEPPPTYKYAYKIVFIQASTSGEGYVGVRPVLFLDDKTFVELESSGDIRTRQQLHENWAFSEVARGLQFWETVYAVYYEVAITLAGGAASGLLKGTARGVLLLTFKEAMKRIATRKLLRKVLLYMAKESLKLMKAGVSAYIITFVKTYHSESAKAKLATRASHGQVNRDVVSVCVAKATGAFAAAVVKEAINPYFKGALEAAGLGWVEKEITERITKAFITSVPTSLINAVADAAAKTANDPGQFDKHLEEELQKQFTGLFKKLVEVDFAKIGASMVR